MQRTSLTPLALALMLALAGCASMDSPQVSEKMNKVGDGTTRATTNVVVKEWEKSAPAPTATATAATPAAQSAPTTNPADTKVVRALGVTPPDAKPGECYAKVLEPAQYREEAYQRVVRPAAERSQWTEAEYQEMQEQVVTRPAYKKAEIVPAVYEDVTEQVVVREAYRREIEVPALYDTYFEQVVERPARKVWKPGRGETEMVDAVTGEILCLVEEPAVYKTVERKELRRAATKRFEDVPAEITTVKKQVLKTPQQTREVDVPAEYTTITVRKLVKPAVEVKLPVDAQTETAYRKVLVADERYAWHEVLCERNATAEKVDTIRGTLSKQGYGPLAKNGAIDADLTNAVSKFQADKGLSVTGLLSTETLSALGVAKQ